MPRLLAILIVLAASQFAFAQQELIELARQDIRAGRMGMIVASMDLTPEQQEKFWPIYREYADEQEALLDKRIAMLKRYAGSLDSMTDEDAIAIAKQSFAIQRERIDRRERYFKRFSKALGPVLAARFLQVDSQMSTLLDFEMARNMPLIQGQQAVGQ